MSSTDRSSASFLSPWISKFVGLSLLPLLLVGPAAGKEKYKEVAVSNGGSIAGEATYRGSPPGPYVIHVTKDNEVFGKTVPDERLIVSPAGKIKNVLITVDGIMEGKPWPELRPQLRNKGGRFVPHFQVARTRSKLEIINDDTVLHNTHAVLRSRTIFNLAQPLQGQVIGKTLKRPGLVEIMCDSHDWMNGWLAVLDHPYYGVTGEDGVYKITDIPAGTYNLTAWHEQLGLQQVQVTVKAGGLTRLNFEFPLK